MSLPTLYSLAEVAEHLKISEEWLRRRRGQFAYTEGMGRSLWFTAEQVDALVAWRSRQPAQTARPNLAQQRRRRSA